MVQLNPLLRIQLPSYLSRDSVKHPVGPMGLVVLPIRRVGQLEVGDGSRTRPPLGDAEIHLHPIRVSLSAVIDFWRDGLYVYVHADIGHLLVWKQQMANIGVNVDIQTVPPEVYYGGEGDADWMQVDFGITEWGARATAVTYFQLAYSSNGQYNESHWSDRVFDRITRQITGELDPQKRIQLYHEAQQILRERGPVIVPYMQAAAAGVNKEVQGIDLATDWPRTFFRSAYFSR